MPLTVNLAQVEEALDRAERTQEEAARHVAAIRKIVEGLRELNGRASIVLGESGPLAVALPAEKVRHPRGQDAIRAIVQDRPGSWSLAELRAAIRERGWFTSSKAVEVAVKRLCDAGDAVRTAEKGIYRFDHRAHARDASAREGA